MNKPRKIILIILLSVVGVMLIMSFANRLSIENKVSKTFLVVMEEKTMTTKILKLIGPAIWIIMLIFALIYTFNKNDNDKKKKWPFIVLIVVASITSLVSLYVVLGDSDQLSIYVGNDGKKLFTTNIFVNNVVIVFSLAALGLSITNLTQVVKGI